MKHQVLRLVEPEHPAKSSGSVVRTYCASADVANTAEQYIQVKLPEGLSEDQALRLDIRLRVEVAPKSWRKFPESAGAKDRTLWVNSGGKTALKDIRDTRKGTEDAHYSEETICIEEMAGCDGRDHRHHRRAGLGVG